MLEENTREADKVEVKFCGMRGGQVISRRVYGEVGGNSRLNGTHRKGLGTNGSPNMDNSGRGHRWMESGVRNQGIKLGP